MIDTHAHVFSDKFGDGRDEMLNRARNAGVERIYMPNINGDSIDDMLALAAADPIFLRPMLGLHPCYVDESWAEHLAHIEEVLEEVNIAAIGETGLDFYWDTTYASEQKTSLKRHVEWALSKDLPIVLHSRSAIDETIEMMVEAGPDIRGIFHCFTGTVAQAERIIDMGFKIGIGGIVTFTNSGLDKVVADIPLESIVLETDSPYLAPDPYRRKTNEPSYLPLIAKKISDIHNCTIEEVERVTNENARAVFEK
ncbi:MAG: YchF/TatD family DNA exonuclease [Bacteroidetes bacterium]|jgi:TatD DNase family protein|nr:YchF/TatD family DNA exonuclease [Bacteroidota bacterium]